jgi:hypothetical protein
VTAGLAGLDTAAATDSGTVSLSEANLADDDPGTLDDTAAVSAVDTAPDGATATETAAVVVLYDAADTAGLVELADADALAVLLALLDDAGLIDAATLSATLDAADGATSGGTGSTFLPDTAAKLPIRAQRAWIDDTIRARPARPGRFTGGPSTTTGGIGAGPARLDRP